MSMVLLVSNDDDAAAQIMRELKGIGMSAVTARLAAGSALMTGGDFGVVLLEALSGIDNIEVKVGAIKNSPHFAHTPIVAIIKQDDVEGIQGIENIDEILISPYNQTEMLVRLQIAARRGKEHLDEQAINIDGLVIDPVGYEVTIDGRPIALTHKEFELLKFLAQNMGRVFARQTLVKAIWKYSRESELRTVDVHIRRLRAKLGTYGDLITTVRNVGYRFNIPSTTTSSLHS